MSEGSIDNQLAVRIEAAADMSDADAVAELAAVERVAAAVALWRSEVTARLASFDALPAAVDGRVVVLSRSKRKHADGPMWVSKLARRAAVDQNTGEVLDPQDAAEQAGMAVGEAAGRLTPKGRMPTLRVLSRFQMSPSDFDWSTETGDLKARFISAEDAEKRRRPSDG